MKAAVALSVAVGLFASAPAYATWVEPVAGPVGGPDTFATSIRGDGSEALVATAQPFTSSSGYSEHLLVASLMFPPWRLSAPLARFPSELVKVGASFTKSGPVYAAWIETRTSPTVNDEVYVDRYNGGGTWVPMAGALNHNETVNADTISPPTVANVGSEPWAAWEEGAGANRTVWVAHLSHNDVSYVGAGIPVTGPPAHPSLTSVGGVGYLAYANSDGVHVMTFQNGRWVDVPGLVAPHGVTPTLANVGDRVFLTWVQAGANGYAQLHAARYVGNGHWLADSSLNVDPNENASGPDIASVAGVPWVVWTESSRPYADTRVLNHIYVRQFNGTSWALVGGVANVDENHDAFAAGISDVGGTAYVAMTQEDSNYRSTARVTKDNGFAPHVSSIAMTPVGNGPATAPARTIRFRITLSEPATIRLDFTQPVKGRRDRGVCVGATRRNVRRPKCTLNVTRGSIAFRGRSGVNTLTFDGTLQHGAHLKPGVYRVVITATDPTGLRSGSRVTRVTI